jgi:hypothetical protein
MGSPESEARASRARSTSSPKRAVSRSGSEPGKGLNQTRESQAPVHFGCNGQLEKNGEKELWSGKRASPKSGSLTNEGIVTSEAKSQNEGMEMSTPRSLGRYLGLDKLSNEENTE